MCHGESRKSTKEGEYNQEPTIVIKLPMLRDRVGRVYSSIVAAFFNQIQKPTIEVPL